ncbi:hypothetical protein TIFTF001_040252 [Ficus carica]|uniref:Uncharacterized protein n=1 Tax=Ficus carica TaxID=3494 RepID=A0AA88CZ62_FICCA|nr:hypothetical protein TIFTF001_040252 [Ficus carica]
MTSDLVGPTVVRFSSRRGRLLLPAIESRISRFIVTIVGTDWFRRQRCNSDFDKDDDTYCFDKDGGGCSGLGQPAKVRFITT